eukprot:GFKZ01000184.1.p1 GENE.GFKZ01000184.1~~GFKZ01000184.1.p1  ORF type:complete len:113 (+),score=5.84 GFKZ01000184.1:276-614(+)
MATRSGASLLKAFGEPVYAARNVREILEPGSELPLSRERRARWSGELQARCETRGGGGVQTISNRLLCLCGGLALGGEVEKEKRLQKKSCSKPRWRKMQAQPRRLIILLWAG